MKLDLSKLIPMGGAMILIWATGVALGYVDALSLGPLSVAMFAVAIIAFVGTLYAGADMRTAITISFVVSYFTLFAGLATSERNRAQFDTVVGQELWDNFTYLVGVIVLFYFGATAATEIAKSIKAVDPTVTTTSSTPAPTTGTPAADTTPPPPPAASTDPTASA